MKEHAICMTAREQAEMVAIPAPGALGSDEIRGNTICTLISPGTELAWNYLGEKFPSFPGYAAVFQVQEIGSEVSSVSTGDLLFCMGSHCSYQQVKAQATCSIPVGLNPETALLARLMGVSMTTLMTTSARPGDCILVTGSGPVGFLAAQMFAQSGYEVLVIEPNAGRRHLVEQAGIERIYSEFSPEVMSLEGKVALVVECSGHEQAVLNGCRIVRRRGEVVLVGVPWHPQTNILAHELLSLVFHKYVILRSGWEWELPLHTSDFCPHSIFSSFEIALRWLASGRIQADKVMRQVDPRTAQSVYQDLLHRRTPELFVVFDWSRIVNSEGENGQIINKNGSCSV